MVEEGLNININDIEDDDLRKEVIKYFKTFKKGKLEDENLDELDDEDKDSKDSGEEDDEGTEEDAEKKKNSKSDIDKLMDTLAEFDDVDDEEEDDPDWDDEDVKESLIIEKSSKTTDDDDHKKTSLFRKIRMKLRLRKIRKQIAYLQHKIDNSDDKNGINRYKSNLNFLKLSSFDSNGNPIISKKDQRDKVAELLSHRQIDSDEIMSRSEMKRLNKDAKSYWKDPSHKSEAKEYKKKAKKIIQKLVDPDQYWKEEAEKELKRKDEKDSDPKSEKKDKEDKEDKKDKEDKEDKKDKEDKDEDGNIIKQEEITDKDGKKKTVTTHTGPRGGKFYWPDGSPKDAEHKVYIGKDGKVKECMDLSDYLYESFK